MIGCERDDFVEFDVDRSVAQGILPAKILYAYPNKTQDADNW